MLDFAIAPRAWRFFIGLLILAVVFGGLAVAFADDAAIALLAASVTVLVLALLWRETARRRAFGGAVIGGAARAPEVAVAVHTERVPEELKTVDRGTVESWDNEEGWGVLSAPELPSGVFASFSAIEGEGFRSLKIGAPVTFDYTPAAVPGGQDGCSYVAERVVQLDD